MSAARVTIQLDVSWDLGDASCPPNPHDYNPIEAYPFFLTRPGPVAGCRTQVGNSGRPAFQACRCLEVGRALSRPPARLPANPPPAAPSVCPSIIFSRRIVC